ncbi:MULTISPECIES: SIS domain-containing protein [unclassified Polaromonas]|jgi:D-sedoheptulose 7-phosphate isomerase|nr:MULTISPECIES: SIS domain-containing protein [unclassified Polaromonas]OYY39788.1 MAG: phosphoheptose isomerase [Polaromonas sp. 35-63-35]OYZ22533.1 MAG: phosphoheptose isomerase [Polaromonas sp. 16-63-31]OYZ81472.1 MAG: phosphoheptose isomerase [Polaromonas sp. 24-63-21]OZA52528.1 MAG: phosphoheptose isomerase [Polaromonas sp. 17-63-33]OZA88833.1 MAG: phosphoheptose isomerase [Polaromonas sp. 39-63-25]
MELHATTQALGELKVQIRASIAVKEKLLADEQLLNQIRQLALSCIAALRSGGKIIFAGNGGSFADAQHLSAEFTSRFLFDRAPLASLALATNNSAISAIGNDYGYEQIFARELQAIAKPEDVFIPISTSGNSANILAAVSVAKELGVTTVAWTGAGGGRLGQMCDCICIPSSETARIQECHILIGHIVCGLVEAGYFLKES